MRGLTASVDPSIESAVKKDGQVEKETKWTDVIVKDKMRKKDFCVSWWIWNWFLFVEGSAHVCSHAYRIFVCSGNHWLCIDEAGEVIYGWWSREGITSSYGFGMDRTTWITLQTASLFFSCCALSVDIKHTKWCLWCLRKRKVHLKATRNLT